jgi:hypothetical protein
VRSSRRLSEAALADPCDALAGYKIFKSADQHSEVGSGSSVLSVKSTMSRKGSVTSRCEEIRVLVGLGWLADYLVYE